MNSQKTNKQLGFTIIELMMATAIFAFVMLICLVSFLQVGRMFYKGVSMANTQESARTIVGDLSDDIRFASNAPTNTTGNYFCIGAHRYVFASGQKFTGLNTGDPSTYGFLRDNNGAFCKPVSSQPLVDPEELLGPGMQVNFTSPLDVVNCVPVNGQGSYHCDVSIHIIFYGVDSGVFTSNAHPNDAAAASKDPDAHCSGGLISSQFCATADLSTSVLTKF